MYKKDLAEESRFQREGLDLNKLFFIQKP